MPDLIPQRQLLARTCVWSPGVPPVRDLRGLPVIPCAQNGKNRPVRAVATRETGLVWAWTTPGDDRALRALGNRLVADVELAGWDGSPDELDDAEALAKVCPAVTTHGFVHKPLRDALAAFAEAGAVVLPQVYDSDRSTLRSAGGPAAFLRRCVAQHRDLGFVEVVPLLGTAAGVPHLRVWRAACEDAGIPFHLWAYGQIVHDPAVLRWVRALAEELADRDPKPENAPVPGDSIAEPAGEREPDPTDLSDAAPRLRSPGQDPRGGAVS